MGLFGKNKVEETIDKKSEEYVLKEELESEVEKLQKEFREKEGEIANFTEKINSVKIEYDTTVTNLMLVKKELNQKKMELDVVLREYKETREKIKNSDKLKDSESITEFKQTQEELSKIKKELEEITKEYDLVKDQMTKEQSSLHITRKQQLEVEKELEEANSRLYNAKEELDKKDKFEDTSILTSDEKQFIQKDEEKSSAGVIEAASVVVGSLKSKLNMTQKELEAIQQQLEKEREDHEITKQELKKLKGKITEES